VLTQERGRYGNKERRSPNPENMDGISHVMMKRIFRMKPT
jgi:hypothetical protein